VANVIAPVVGAPSLIERQIGRLRDRLHSAAIEVRRQVESAEMRRLLGILDDLRDRLKNPDGYRSQETEDAVAPSSNKAIARWD